MLTEIESKINLIEDLRGRDEGVITKINRTRAVVDMRGSSWTVPFSMITKEK